MLSLVLVAGVLLLSGSCVFAVPVADSMYKTASSEENQVLNLDELQSLDNNFLLWNPPAVMPRTSLNDAIRDLEAAEQLKNGTVRTLENSNNLCLLPLLLCINS
ncbi:hypothetical protein chiPu_0015479 [Chiloscyllium punctatum]|uniref:Uncharacterized protein n=1 Tax=Chiloscyllium punctatum TaxID=137246 RepID=A0A401T2U2_CHIPU|nr:hypothetical protein [Chiloscyllium punctatum]